MVQVQNEIVEDVARGELMGLYPYPGANNAVNAVIQLPNNALEYREPGMLEQPQPGMQKQPVGPGLDDHYTCQ